jgi:L-iditol 2-dehydrogenase
MKTAYLEEIRHIVIKEVDKPSYGPYEALIKVRVSGICGSDVHTYRGHHPFRKPPVVLGHEVAGEIISVGDRVTRVKVGDRVALEPQIPCGICTSCVRGTPNLCRNKRVPGVGWDGTFSEFIVAPEGVLHKLNEGIGYDEGALIEPTAVAYRAFRLGAVSYGKSVAVLGAGAIGCLAAHFCQMAGAQPLLVTDIKDYNLAFIHSAGQCQPANPLHEDVLALGNQITAGEGFDVVIVTSGARDSLDEAIHLCRPQGVVVVVSVSPNDMSIDANLLLTKEVQVRGTITYTSEDFREAAALVNSRNFDVRPFVTQHVTLDEVPEVFEMIDNGMDHIKVVIDFTPEGEEAGKA